MKTFRNRVVTENEKILPMQNRIATNIAKFPLLLGTKILRYWRRMESLMMKTPGM